MVHTPCIGNCKAPNGICHGCLRTRKEIGRWLAMPEHQQLSTIHALRPEKGTHQCPSCHQPAQCDIANGKTHCWCFDVEKVPNSLTTATEDNTQCLCRQCLKNAFD